MGGPLDGPKARHADKDLRPQASSNGNVWVAGAEQDVKPRCRRGVEDSAPATPYSRHKKLKFALNCLAEGGFRFALYPTHPWKLEWECAKRCFQAEKRSFELAKRLENRPCIAPCCNTENLSHFSQLKTLSALQANEAQFCRIPLQKNEVRSSFAIQRISASWRSDSGAPCVSPAASNTNWFATL